MTTTLDVVKTLTENGVITTDSFSVKITVETIPTPVKYIILEMSAANDLISQSEFEPDKITETFQTKPTTAYIIIEAHTRDGAGAINITREIHDRETDHFETLYERADGIGIKVQTEIMWG